LGFSSFWFLLLDAMTILTFLMVFLLQNSQNRHAKTTHLKLNELIRAVEGAHRN
jgi:low affinity Fe/Cu permease